MTLVTVLGLVGLFLVLLPLFLWGLLGEEAGPRFDAVDPVRNADPPEVAAFLRDNVAALTAEGFTQVGDLVRYRGMLKTRVALLQDEDGVTCTVLLVSTTQGTVSPMVEFTAELTDTRGLDVNNATTPPLWPPQPGHESYRLPDVRDPARLHRIFRVLRQRRFGAAALRRREIAADPARFLATVFDESHDWLIAAGYYRRDRKANRFKPTLKGAYLMTWKMLPPFVQIRRFAMRRRGRRLLREIAMEGPDQRPVAAPDRVAATTAHEPPHERPAPAGTKGPSGTLLWVGIVAVFGASLAANRLISGFLGVTILFGGMLALLWLGMRGRGGGRLVAPLAVIAALGWGTMGFREFQSRRPIAGAGLAVPADFAGAVDALARLARTKARRLVVRDADGQPDTTAGFYVAVREPQARAILDSAIRRQFADRGFYLFWSHRSNGRRGRFDRIGLYPSRDQYAVLRAMRTSGRQVSTRAIERWLRAVEGEHPLRMITITPHLIEGELAVDSANASALAGRFTEFCPDLERRGSTTTAGRAESLRRFGYFYCWWEGGEP